MVQPREEIRRIAMFKNGHLRLLMTLVGFERGGLDDDADAPWTIPSSLSADQLKQPLELIQRAEFNPPVFDDGQEAGDFIRRKSAGLASRRRAMFDDSDEVEDGEELMFPAGGPTAMRKSDALEVLKKIRRRRRREGSDDEPTGLTDEQLQARAEARRARELEKNRKIKSELFVHDSDEEEDEERDRVFFEAEEKLRQRSNQNIMKELLGISKSKDKPNVVAASRRLSSVTPGETDEDDETRLPSIRKRQSSAISIDSDDNEVDAEVEARSGRSSSSVRDNILAESEGEITDTPMSSPHIKSSQAKRRKVLSNEVRMLPKPSSLGKENQRPLADGSDDDDEIPVARPVRQRVRSGFIIESSDEE